MCWQLLSSGPTLIVKHTRPAKQGRIELISMIVYNNHDNNCNMLPFVRKNDSPDPPWN